VRGWITQLPSAKARFSLRESVVAVLGRWPVRLPPLQGVRRLGRIRSEAAMEADGAACRSIRLAPRGQQVLTATWPLHIQRYCTLSCRLPRTERPRRMRGPRIEEPAFDEGPMHEGHRKGPRRGGWAAVRSLPAATVLTWLVRWCKHNGVRYTQDLVVGRRCDRVQGRAGSFHFRRRDEMSRSDYTRTCCHQPMLHVKMLYIYWYTPIPAF
jgi:hypothetical protein